MTKSGQWARLKCGGQWARLKCLDVKTGIRIEEQDLGAVKVEREVRTEVYVLQCECGRQFEVDAEKFAGKRTVKDCGCGLADLDGVTDVLVCRLRLEAVVSIRRLAADTAGGNVSLAVCRLLRKGMDMEVKASRRRMGTFSVTVPASLKGELIERAEKQGIGYSWLVREILEKGL